MPGAHGGTATLLTIIFKPKIGAFHERQTHHYDTSSIQNSIEFFFLPVTLAVRHLSSSFTFSFCKLQLLYL